MGCIMLFVAFVFILQPTTALAEESPTTDGKPVPTEQQTSAKDPVNAGDLTPGAIEQNDANDEPEKTIPVYRMYNGFSGEHFYTTSEKERDHLIDVGWFYEGIGWQAPESSKTPVYRLYNPYAGDHHYTTSVKERDILVKAKWKYEGESWYSDDAKAIPILRQYNSHARTGTHNFTYSQNENDSLTRAGWKAEGVSWYASAEGKSERLTWFSRTHLYALATCIAGGSSVVPGYDTTIDSAKMNRLKSLIATRVPIGFVAINARTGKSVARNADMRIFSASTIKAPFIAALCKYKAPNLGAWIEAMQNIIQWSSNEDYHDLANAYGTGYETAFIHESTFHVDYPYSYGYADLTPRELAKLWITVRSFIISNDTNSGLFRSLFNRGYFKEGWMESYTWSGEMYHIAGVEGDVVYAVMTRYEYGDSRVWAIRNAAIAAVS